MAKPKLLLFGGYGWAGSSPLFYTLQRNVKYAHFGYTKCFIYLKKPKWKGDPPTLKFKESRMAKLIYDATCNGTWENWKSYTPSTHRMNLTCDLEPLKDFPLYNFHKLMEGDPSISKYLDYYHALHDHVISKGYKCVGDGHTGRCETHNFYTRQPENSDIQKQSIAKIFAIKKYVQELKSEFDVKVIVIVRDPVRRAFSNYLAMVKKHETANRDDGATLPQHLRVYDYIHDFNRLKRFWGNNFHAVVMEELWEGDGVSELSEFLDHPIEKTDLWKNVYSPDIGHYAKYDIDVPCQAFGQDVLELKPHVYNHLRKKYDYIYRKWEQTFGSLPMHWGEPIEYRG